MAHGLFIQLMVKFRTPLHGWPVYTSKNTVRLILLCGSSFLCFCSTIEWLWYYKLFISVLFDFERLSIDILWCHLDFIKVIQLWEVYRFLAFPCNFSYNMCHIVKQPDFEWFSDQWRYRLACASVYHDRVLSMHQCFLYVKVIVHSCLRQTTKATRLCCITITGFLVHLLY